MNLLSRLTDLPKGHRQQGEDFDKRFLNTYLILEEDEKQKPIQYIGREGYKLHFQHIDGSVLVLDGRSDIDNVHIFLPSIGYYNHRGTPFYLIKNPTRQWKRSFCSGIYKIIDNRGMGRHHWGMYAESILQSQYAHLDEITNPLFTNIAINRKFAMQSKTTDLSTLLYKQYEIGRFDFSRKEICLTQPALRQELQDLFKYSGVSKWKLNLTTAV